MKALLDKALLKLEKVKNKKNASTPATPSSVVSTPLQTPPPKRVVQSPTEPTPAKPCVTGASLEETATEAAEKPSEAEDCFPGYPWVVFKARIVIC